MDNIDIQNNMKEAEAILQQIDSTDTVEFSEWTREKVTLRYKSEIPSFPIYNNFIYWCNLGVNIGSEQNKLRPVLVVKTSKASSICTIIPLSSKRLNDGFWFHIDLEELDATALVEQLRVVSKLRLVNPFRLKGNLLVITQNDWSKINLQLESLYKLKPLKEQ